MQQSKGPQWVSFKKVKTSVKWQNKSYIERVLKEDQEKVNLEMAEGMERREGDERNSQPNAT